MDELIRLLKTIRTVSTRNPVTYIQLSEIIKRLWRPRVIVYPVYQENHGFVVGDVIKPTDPLWVKAQADTDAHAHATAIVSEVIDENNFLYVQEGIVTGDYEIGKTYFLSIAEAGKTFVQSAPEVWSIGQYRQMIGTGTAEGLLVEIDEGAVIKQDTTPHIGENGNWYIGPTDTGIPAQGPAGANGADGTTPHIGANGNWWIDAIDTGIPATGPAGADGADGAPGADGITPHIGLNGNWWIDTTDTGIAATGPAGADGAPGADGSDGAPGADGLPGADGVGIASVTLVSTVGLVKTYRITFTDATTFDYVVTDGADGTVGGGADLPELHLDFDEAGDEFTYNVPYNMKFTSMVCEGTDPTLSVALNTNLARYDKLTVTATASGLISLYGEYV